MNREIIGGSDAAQGTFGFMAFVVYFDSAGNPVFNCSGTVISPNLVLTAGHCATDETTGLPLDPGGYGIVTGSVDWTNSAQRQLSRVSRVIVNPSFNPNTITGDAALLQLATPTTAPAIRLASSTETSLYNPGTYALIAGWGAMSNTAVPFVLQWASTTVQGATYCGQHDTIFSSFWETCAIQAPGFSTATCNGDSGGPLIAADAAGNAVEIGVTSYGPVDCNTSTIDVYTRADAISSWAASWVSGTSPTPPPPPPPPTTTAPPPSTTAPPAQTPPASTPPPTPPAITMSQVRSYARQMVNDRTHRTPALNLSCARVSLWRFDCSIEWLAGSSHYLASGRFYNYLQNGRAYWWYDFTVKRSWLTCRTRHGTSRCTTHRQRLHWH